MVWKVLKFWSLLLPVTPSLAAFIEAHPAPFRRPELLLIQNVLGAANV
jgi:hypothetical protein